MSTALYQTRLLWNGRLGLAKHRGVVADLTRFPAAALPGMRVDEMDYVPEVRACSVRELHQPSREMTAIECRSVRAWLDGLADAAQRFIEGDMT